MKIASQAKQEFTVILQLTEDEARALHDITGYGYEAFIKVFKEHLGKSYIEKHEKGAKSLFEVVRNVMPQHFYKIDTARNAFTSVNKHLD
jgi:hypothetical protein